MSRVFCIGNGESRLGFDLERLRKLGTIMGCNALYRDFRFKRYILPHYLVAIDDAIVTEIESSILNV